MARGNSGENEGIQRRIVSKLCIFYLKSPGSYEHDMAKNKFMEKPFQTVIISKVELSKLNYPHSFHISWEEAAM